MWFGKARWMRKHRYSGGLLRMMSWHPGSIDNVWTSSPSFYNITEAIVTCIGSMLFVFMVVRFRFLPIKPIYLSHRIQRNRVVPYGHRNWFTSRRTTSGKSAWDETSVSQLCIFYEIYLTRDRLNLRETLYL
ncbi:hypothetical protein VN97_g7487 [Penicillium thymicola]|uniref:Uncharacterized protein n=1 Tax=Penicillium thymicola TaxID=293382 RepID=A0AAI9TEF4_PENTH|nr:hypothetical protein VN97_g7487 [Penicillium thymicola]